MSARFLPPTGRDGRMLSYREWRARNGVPMSPEEMDAQRAFAEAAECMASDRPNHANYFAARRRFNDETLATHVRRDLARWADDGGRA